MKPKTDLPAKNVSFTGPVLGTSGTMTFKLSDIIEINASQERLWISAALGIKIPVDLSRVVVTVQGERDVPGEN